MPRLLHRLYSACPALLLALLWPHGPLARGAEKTAPIAPPPLPLDRLALPPLSLPQESTQATQVRRRYDPALTKARADQAKKRLELRLAFLQKKQATEQLSPAEQRELTQLQERRAMFPSPGKGTAAPILSNTPPAPPR